MGRLIGIEGVDAVGKQTQSLLLRSWLRQKHLRTRLLSFPSYDTPIGREVRAFLAGKRSYPVELRHMLFSANRWERYHELNNLLEKGYTVIVNRYMESNLVYGEANGLSLDWLLSLETGLPKTDLVIVLDAPPSILRSRRTTNKDIYESDTKLQARVRLTYRKLARKFNWVIIRATGDKVNIHKSIIKIVSLKLFPDKSETS